ncbi:primary amine oxidase [Quercus suber]|uniref:Primary amine oxidase n=1 Tax=Quercus suber TaxID=58331 RepID=A0AAW0LM29_QUESU
MHLQKSFQRKGNRKPFPRVFLKTTYNWYLLLNIDHSLRLCLRIVCHENKILLVMTKVSMSFVTISCNQGRSQMKVATVQRKILIVSSICEIRAYHNYCSHVGLSSILMVKGTTYDKISLISNQENLYGTLLSENFHVINPSKRTRVGNPVGYKVVPGGTAAS